MSRGLQKSFAACPISFVCLKDKHPFRRRAKQERRLFWMRLSNSSWPAKAENRSLEKRSEAPKQSWIYYCHSSRPATRLWLSQQQRAAGALKSLVRRPAPPRVTHFQMCERQKYAVKLKSLKYLADIRKSYAAQSQGFNFCLAIASCMQVL